MIENFIIALGNSYMELFLTSKLLDKKIDVKNWKNILIFLGLSIYILVAYSLTMNVMRVVVSFALFTIVNQIIFKENSNKTILVTASCMTILVLSEMIYILISMIVLSLTIEEYKIIFLNSVIGNLLVFGIAYLIINIGFIRNKIRNLINIAMEKIDRSVIVFATLIIITFALLLFLVYYKLNTEFMLILNIAIIFMYITIGYYFMKEKKDNIKIKSEFQLATNNFKEFEKKVSVQSKRNHDTKNDLITIRGMLKSKSDTTDILDYIDDMASMERLSKDDEFLTDQIINIPIPALQELIYQKMHIMKERNILSTLSLDNSIKGTKEIDWTGKKIKSICTVIGIYLDNAIEETEKISDKEVKIEIIKKNDTIAIAISNTFNGTIDFEQMEEDGYSSKGLGRGHGLNIAKEIIQKNDFLNHEIEIHGRVFCQILKIKM